MVGPRQVSYSAACETLHPVTPPEVTSLLPHMQSTPAMISTGKYTLIISHSYSLSCKHTYTYTHLSHIYCPDHS